MRKLMSGDRVQLSVNVKGGHEGAANMEIRSATAVGLRSGMWEVLIDGDSRPVVCYRVDLALLPKVEYLSAAERAATSKLIVTRQYEKTQDHLARRCSCGTGPVCGF
jgi:hypothetical protein